MRTDKERSAVRFATPYLELQTQSVCSLERTIGREPAQGRLDAKRKKQKGSDQSSSIRIRST